MMKSPLRFASLLAGLALVGCSSGSILGTGDLVTVSGSVTNVDTQSPAANIKVYLYNHEDDYNTETNELGQFSIKIPVGTRFILVTDDADGSSKDDWFRLANFEAFKPVVDKGFSGYVIHACPTVKSSVGVESAIATAYATNADFYMPLDYASTTKTDSQVLASTNGSVSVWEELLANTAAGDKYFPGINTVSEASGIISMSIARYSPGTGTGNAPDIQVISDSEDEFGPIVYSDGYEYYFVDVPGTDTERCDVYLPGKLAVVEAEAGNVGVICDGVSSASACRTDRTNAFSLIWSFGKSNFDGKAVKVSFANKDTGRTISNLPQDLELFVEPNMISLVLFSIVDENGDDKYEAMGFGESLSILSEGFPDGPSAGPMDCNG